MPNVTCPSCGEKGKIPPQYIGTRIKCKKCGNAFLVTAPAPKAATPGAEGPATPSAAAAQVQHGTGDHIAVEGLDDAAWEAAPTAPADHHAPAHEHHDEATSAFTAHSEAQHEPGAVKQYRFLSSKDHFFDSTRYDLETIEQALNQYAKQGWVAKAIATTHVIIRGIEKDQLVVLMER
jgi:hypothetical protein